MAEEAVEPAQQAPEVPAPPGQPRESGRGGVPPLALHQERDETHKDQRPETDGRKRESGEGAGEKQCSEGKDPPHPAARPSRRSRRSGSRTSTSPAAARSSTEAYRVFTPDRSPSLRTPPGREGRVSRSQMAASPGRNSKAGSRSTTPAPRHARQPALAK